MFNQSNALGCNESHVINVVLGDQKSSASHLTIHKQLQEPLMGLYHAAAAAGFKLGVASGFRSFKKQQQIWDAKALGQRVVLDQYEKPLAIKSLAPKEQVTAILRWSALPGASRHHWGCDFDVYDAGALPQRSTLALTVDEARTQFAEFYCWLDEYLAQQSAFFRPFYGVNPGAVANEPWHLSFLPLAKKYEKLCDYELLRTQLITHNVQLLNPILGQLPHIYRDYVAAYFTRQSALNG